MQLAGFNRLAGSVDEMSTYVKLLPASSISHMVIVHTRGRSGRSRVALAADRLDMCVACWDQPQAT
jgi:hypothetical protein